jgi:hypothetical protein
LCLNEETLDGPENCSLCEEKTTTYSGVDRIEKFVDYIHELSKNAKKCAANILAIAHNGKGYDHHFILREIVSRNYLDVDLIVQGSKLLRLKVGNVKFIDSFAIMNLPLKSLSLAYGIEDVSKGFFLTLCTH